MDHDPEPPLDRGDLAEQFHSAVDIAQSDSQASLSDTPGAAADTASSPDKPPESQATSSPSRPIVPLLKLPSPPPPPPPGPASPSYDLSPSTASPSPRRSGAALFSVPPAAAPDTGVYGMPLEAFEFKDLDTGRTFYLDKRYWIKDVDTGKVYVLEPPEAGGSAAVPSAASMRVSDLISGQDVSLEEFEQTLGYFKETPPAAAAAAGEEDSEGGDIAAQAQQLAQRGIQSISLAAQASASWIRDKAAAARDRLAPPRDPTAAYGAATPSAAAAAAAARAGDASPTSVASSSRAADGQGLPVKVAVSKKPFKEFTDVRLVQTLPAHAGVVWTMRFSKSGRYLATAGQDCVVTVWEVVTHRERERSGAAGGGGGDAAPDGASDPGSPSSSRGGDAGAGGTTATGATYGVPVLRPRPLRTYRGHRQDVLDVAWSKTNFLLSASMDKSVRLWHVSMDECLRVFKHTDFVTAIAFHPSDDKFFVSGSIDGKVRLWNVPEQRVASWQDVHDMVTAVGYSRDGQRAVVGTMRGKCRFYCVSARGGLEYEAQLDVKNKRGQHARGKKVTGLHFAPSSATALAGGASGSANDASSSTLLITSNDSRVRLYEGYTLRAKYKGHSNKSTQIKASFSPAGEFVICGSDDGAVYVWSTRKAAVPGSPERSAVSKLVSGGGGGGSDQAPSKEKNASFESFQVASDVITVALFGPECTHRPLDAMSPTAAAAAAEQAGGAAPAPARPAAAAARGQVILAAGYSGEIKIYENVGLPQWL